MIQNKIVKVNHQCGKEQMLENNVGEEGRSPDWILDLKKKRIKYLGQG